MRARPTIPWATSYRIPLTSDPCARYRRIIPRTWQYLTSSTNCPSGRANRCFRIPNLRTNSSEVGKSVESIGTRRDRSEEHTSELQSRQYLVCRLLLEKNNNQVAMFSAAR